MNHFEWPGADIRDDDLASISLGFLPHKVTTRLREMIRARVREKNILTVDRDFDTRKTLDELREKKDKDRDPKR